MGKKNIIKEYSIKKTEHQNLSKLNNTAELFLNMCANSLTLFPSKGRASLPCLEYQLSLVTHF